MKTIRRSHKFKLTPTSAQLQMFNQFAGNSRFVYNALLEWSSWVYKRHERRSVVNRAALCKQVTQMKGDFDFLKLSHVHTLQSSADNLLVAYKKFFTRQGGYPKFKKKHSRTQSFTYKSGVKVDGNRVWLPKVGWVKFRRSMDAIGQIKKATVSRKQSGWYVSLSVVEGIEVHPESAALVGVDLGLKHFAIFSDGTKIENPKFFKESQAKLRKLQRSMARKKKGSANYAKARKKVALLHERIANQRKDFQHKLTSKLVVDNQVIGIETLVVRNMVKNRRLAKAISDAGWCETLRQIKYKAGWHNRAVDQKGQWFPSSKTTHCCGVHLPDLTLGDRVIVCPNCGQAMDRDVNAALNLKPVAAGHAETVNACGVACKT